MNSALDKRNRVMKLQCSSDEALKALQSVPHKTFQNAIFTYWHVDAKGNVSPQSVLWLFCWAKDGMGSEAVREKSQKAFNELLEIPYEEFDHKIPHEWARQKRYSPEDLEAELDAVLSGTKKIEDLVIEVDAEETEKVGKKIDFHGQEKENQICFKHESSYLSYEARERGPYVRGYTDICLPLEKFGENIFGEIRQDVLDYFERCQIHWHDIGKNHLLSSQTFCLNFLFPFIHSPEALLQLLRPIFKHIERVLPLTNGNYIEFEWNGSKNYLNEPGWGKRGSLSTCPDAAILAEAAGSKLLILIEWKYTESYLSSRPKGIGKSGENRKQRYRPFYEKNDCPINKKLMPQTSDEALTELFYEPFYQLFREQLLANEMENSRELGAEKVCLVYVAPSKNRALLNSVTSPYIKERFPDQSVCEVWKSLLVRPDRFIFVPSENFLPQKPLPGLENWWQYLVERYQFLRNV